MATAIILGGTKGLGFELARVGAEKGCQSIIYSRSLTEQSSALLPNVVFHSLDLFDSNSLDKLILDTPPVQYFFWVAGVFLKERLIDTNATTVDQMVNLHLSSPIKFISKFLQRQQQTPFHLLTIASSSSWRLRENEAIYCGLKAAQAAFTRNLAVEIARDSPGTKVTLVNPGGLQTLNFWKATQQDTSEFLDPNKVAHIIWNIIQNQKQTFQEVQILRKKPIVVGSEPLIEFGPKTPEVMNHFVDEAMKC